MSDVIDFPKDKVIDCPIDDELHKRIVALIYEYECLPLTHALGVLETVKYELINNLTS